MLHIHSDRGEKYLIVMEVVLDFITINTGDLILSTVLTQLPTTDCI